MGNKKQDNLVVKSSSFEDNYIHIFAEVLQKAGLENPVFEALCRERDYRDSSFSAQEYDLSENIENLFKEADLSVSPAIKMTEKNLGFEKVISIYISMKGDGLKEFGKRELKAKQLEKMILARFEGVTLEDISFSIASDSIKVVDLKEGIASYDVMVDCNYKDIKPFSVTCTFCFDVEELLRNSFYHITYLRTEADYTMDEIDKDEHEELFKYVTNALKKKGVVIRD